MYWINNRYFSVHESMICDRLGYRTVPNFVHKRFDRRVWACARACACACVTLHSQTTLAVKLYSICPVDGKQTV